MNYIKIWFWRMVAKILIWWSNDIHAFALKRYVELIKEEIDNE